MPLFSSHVDPSDWHRLFTPDTHNTFSILHWPSPKPCAAILLHSLQLTYWHAELQLRPTYRLVFPFLYHNPPPSLPPPSLPLCLSPSSPPVSFWPRSTDPKINKMNRVWAAKPTLQTTEHLLQISQPVFSRSPPPFGAPNPFFPFFFSLSLSLPSFRLLGGRVPGGKREKKTPNYCQENKEKLYFFFSPSDTHPVPQ
jgi:hypothetical protein